MNTKIPLTININEYVLVKLTQFGKYILQTSDEAEFIDMNPEGYHKFQLYKLMNLYGQYLVMGAVQMPFENNEIVYLKED